MAGNRKGKKSQKCCAFKGSTVVASSCFLWAVVWILLQWNWTGNTVLSGTLPARDESEVEDGQNRNLKLEPVQKTTADKVKEVAAAKQRQATAAARPGQGKAKEGSAKKKPSKSPTPPSRSGPPKSACPQRAKKLEKWGEVIKDDMKIIKKASKSIAASCERWGEALVLNLRLSEAKSLGGHAYEMPFPDYIVADEPGVGWRQRRSTLQLLAFMDGSTALQPLGPAHCGHDFIASDGDGAFSHWREPLTWGPTARSKLRFSLPGNVGLDKTLKLLAVVFPMVPRMGLVEYVHKPNKKAEDYDADKRRRRKELYREMFFQTFPTVGVEPLLAQKPDDTVEGVWYLWRASHHDEFNIELKSGEIYEKRMPLVFRDFFSNFEQKGAILFPPPKIYEYYENKVSLTRLFQKAAVPMPKTWIFDSEADAMKKKGEVDFPVVVKDPYGYSSIGILQAADSSELTKAVHEFFAEQEAGLEVLVQKKVVALREARVTYVDGRPFHGYWRIRQSLTSASAASTKGGFQDFNFPLEQIAPFVAKFANMTGIPVGGVDFIWSSADPDVTVEPYTLEVSPTSDINPATPPGWKLSYAEFKEAKDFRSQYLNVRRQWTDAMTLAVVDRYRRSRPHLFIGLAVLFDAENGEEAKEGASQTVKALRRSFFVRIMVTTVHKDGFNSALTLLHMAEIEYDDLILLQKQEHKLYHLDEESLLLDEVDEDFSEKLKASGLHFVNSADFEIKDGKWDEVLAKTVNDGLRRWKR